MHEMVLSGPILASPPIHGCGKSAPSKPYTFPAHLSRCIIAHTALHHFSRESAQPFISARNASAGSQFAPPAFQRPPPQQYPGPPAPGFSQPQHRVQMPPPGGFAAPHGPRWLCGCSWPTPGLHPTPPPPPPPIASPAWNHSAVLLSPGGQGLLILCMDDCSVTVLCFCSAGEPCGRLCLWLIPAQIGWALLPSPGPRECHFATQKAFVVMDFCSLQCLAGL